MRNLFWKMLLGIGLILAGLIMNAMTALATTKIAETIELSPKEFLKVEIKKQKLTDRDFTILKEVIRCESSWSQVWESGKNKGQVKVANGNIGLMQINRVAHQKEYKKLKLDPYNAFDNLKYGIILYKRNGVRDWEKWSGHCWKPALAKMGIIINNKKK